MNPLKQKSCQQRLPRFLGFISIASNESVCGILCSLSFYLVGKILTQCLNSELQEDGRRVPENPEPWTWFWVNSDICSVSYTWVMIAVSNSWNCSATRSAVCWTSWWFRCCDVMPAARLVIQEMPQTSIPM